MSVAYYKKELEKARKEKRYAWGQYFQMRNELFEEQERIYEFMENPVYVPDPQNIFSEEDMNTIHLQNFISGLYKKAKACVECSICLDKIEADDLETTGCGHNFHKECMNQLKTHSTEKWVDCPNCRKKVWIKKMS